MEAPVGDAHARAIDDLTGALAVDPGQGLAPEEAARRAALEGPNALQASRPEPLAEIAFEAATEPFVILLAVAGLLAILLGEVRDGLLVLLGLIPIVGADVATEYRAERALEALRAASAPVARVRRGGIALDVAAASLVPGDVVLLRTGDVVPADIRLTSVRGLLLDQSVLTGESVPEPGSVAPDPPGAPLADRRSIAHSGTSVVGGRGEGIVVAIGPATEFGRIAGGLTDRERRRSPLQRELDRLIRILLAVAVGLIVTVTGLGFLRGQEAGANVLAGISAAIAAIPEEPPILLAVVLGLGAYRLLKRGVLVRRLNAEETLGAIDLIVTDKTGTLTENRLRVSSVRTPEGSVEDPARRLQLLTDALRAEEDAWTEDGAAVGAFSRALLEAVRGLGGSELMDAEELLDATAVSKEAPLARTRTRRDGTVEELALGAPEAVLALAGGRRVDEHGRWRALVDRSADQGERLLALAGRREGEPWGMRALIGFADPLRPGIAAALRMAVEAGIQTIVVTGDHPLTAAAIARAAGVKWERVVTGEELAGWDDGQLAAELPNVHIVARSTPEQKERLVRVARANGRMVAVTGDGVNDAPALHRADVAVAMGSGTAVAREASDLVLGDDSFATLMYGLAEGRRIVDNVRKGLVFLISTHVALLGFVLIATLYGFGQPLLPIQILWLELFIDVSTSVAFEREPPEPDLMRRPPRPVGQPILSGRLLAAIAAAGAYSAVGALVLMATHDTSLSPGAVVNLGSGEDAFTHARWVAFTALVVGQAVRAYANRSLREPVHRLAPNRVLAVGALGVILVQAAIPSIPPIAEAFRASPLDLSDWALVFLVAVVPALLAELVRSTRRVAWVA